MADEPIKSDTSLIELLHSNSIRLGEHKGPRFLEVPCLLLTLLYRPCRRRSPDTAA
jgi:hypothetical protein